MAWEICRTSGERQSSEVSAAVLTAAATEEPPRWGEASGNARLEVALWEECCRVDCGSNGGASAVGGGVGERAFGGALMGGGEEGERRGDVRGTVAVGGLGPREAEAEGEAGPPGLGEKKQEEEVASERPM